MQLDHKKPIKCGRCDRVVPDVCGRCRTSWPSGCEFVVQNHWLFAWRRGTGYVPVVWTNPNPPIKEIHKKGKSNVR